MPSNGDSTYRNEDKDNYYNILGVDKSATNAQIK